MSGKQHSVIGAVFTIGLFVFMFLYSSTNLSLVNLIPIVVGSVVGSLIVDIDSKKSKASKKFTKIVTILLWCYLIFCVIDKYLFPQVFTVVTKSLSSNKEGYGLILNFVPTGLKIVESRFWFACLCVLTTLGKISPHRQFTHKWFGASLFCICSYLTFSNEFAVGFILGYILHLLADKTTKAGLRILEFRLPCQDSNGKFEIHS